MPERRPRQPRLTKARQNTLLFLALATGALAAAAWTVNLRAGHLDDPTTPALADPVGPDPVGRIHLGARSGRRAPGAVGDAVGQ